MTKTYNDIEAVTRLLEEKEKDLELTARIGKELLSANARLESRAAALDAELRAARDEATQLQHQLHAKSDLLQVLTDDTEDGEAGLDAECGGTAELLQRRAGALERENRALRDEASRLAAGADRAEQDERRLLRDIAQQLASANSEANSMGTELMSERERVLELTDQLLATTQRMQQTERALNQLKHEHEHTLQILEITRENQNALASELGDSKDRYNELAAHLAEAQEQLRRLREKPTARGGALMPYVAAAAGLHHDSLHAELHSSLYSDLSLDSGIFDPARGSNVKKVFETVAYASRWTGSSAHSGAASVDSGAGGGDGFKTRMTHSIADSVIDNVSEADLEELYPGGIGGCGVPGVPGAAELAEALQRLTPADVASRRATLSSAPLYDGGRESAVWGVGGPGAWRLPSRLQIVKPMEGSQTLGHWAQLAKPTMSGLLEERVGVGVRGGRSAAQLGLAVYSLSDLEEDDELPRFPHASHVTTITNSMVMHPDDGSMCASVMSSNVSSVMGSAWSSLASSRRTSAMPSAAHSPCATPRLLSRRNSTAAGLPPRVVFSPTATPANSPMLGSPSDSPPPTPTATAPSLTSLIASGTDILRRTFLSPGREPHSPASHSPLALHTPGSLYAGLAHRSPMEQLTCLKRTLYPGVRQRPPEPATPTIREEESALGVPAAPGCGALERGVRRRTARVPRPRGDLGTVGAAQPAVHTTALGTLSTLLFGRKGGLL